MLSRVFSSTKLCISEKNSLNHYHPLGFRPCVHKGRRGSAYHIGGVAPNLMIAPCILVVGVFAIQGDFPFNARMAAHALLLFVLLSCLTVPAAAENVFTNGLVYLPIYLGIATIANVILVVRAWQAWRKYFRSESSALTILMLSGIAWYAPHSFSFVTSPYRQQPPDGAHAPEVAAQRGHKYIQNQKVDTGVLQLQRLPLRVLAPNRRICMHAALL